MKIQELRDLSVLELEKLLEDKKQALFNLRFQKAKGTLENTNMLKNTKVDIARISTLLIEKAEPAEPISEPIKEKKQAKAKKSVEPISEPVKEKKSTKAKKTVMPISEPEVTVEPISQSAEAEEPISQSAEAVEPISEPEEAVEPISESEEGDN